MADDLHQRPSLVSSSSRPSGESATRLAAFVRADCSAILAAWRVRIESTRTPDGPSLVTHGAGVLEWIAGSLEGKANDGPDTLPASARFGAPRAVAELTLLAETIGALQPPSVDTGVRDSLQRLIASGIAQSLARDGDEAERLRKRLRLATDLTLVGYWELDPESGVVGADARTRELLDLVDLAVGGLLTVDALTARLHVDDRERVRLGIASALGASGPYMDDCRIVRPGDGACRWLSIAADAHRGAPVLGMRVIGIVHDITDRKRTEEEHARVVEELSRAVHISEMFVGILSHDLRNPLGAILGGAQLLGSAPLSADRSTRILSLIVSSGERMGRMIDQLLDFTRSRLGEGIPLERGPLDLAEVARQAVEESEAATAGTSIRLTTKGDTSGTWDKDRLSQVLSNLVGNALQHGRPTSGVDVVLDGTDAEHVSLSVENVGDIPDDILPVIFNPFRGTLQKRG